MGYHVEMIDNQKTYEKESSFTYSLNSYLYNKEICQISYDVSNEQSTKYDAELINDNLPLDAPCRFIIYHLMGQHNYAKDRFPEKSGFDKFTADSIHRFEKWIDNNKKQEIAEYDNSTLYNDYIKKF